tara:strand:- start:121 stop:384 length:264 start_codon:yes stop_codon:yes gene_type:complete
MINDNLEAYRRAVADTAKARAIFRLNPHSNNNDNLVSCMEEEQLRLDGLMSVIRMVIQDAAEQQPHNPFSINSDVNQPSSSPPPRRD